MEEQQVPPSQPAIQFQQTLEGGITPEQLAEMKGRAKELALQQAMLQQQVAKREFFTGDPAIPRIQTQQQPQVVYVRRNLTVAELLLVLLLSCGIVTGIQFIWYGLSNILPRIEVKVR